MSEQSQVAIEKSPGAGCNPRRSELVFPSRPEHVREVYAAATDSEELGKLRLSSGGFLAKRGHGIVDGNSGVVYPVQRELKRVDCYGATQDGKFGGATERGVREFQVRYNKHFGLKKGDRDYLPVTGVVDYYTWELLRKWDPKCLPVGQVVEKGSNAMRSEELAKMSLVDKPRGDMPRDVKPSGVKPSSDSLEKGALANGVIPAQAQETEVALPNVATDTKVIPETNVAGVSMRRFWPLARISGINLESSA